MNAKFSIVLALLFLDVEPLWAETDHEVLAGITEGVRGFIASSFRREGSSDLKIDVLPPDPRLRLTRCGIPLEFFSPQGRLRSGVASVGVRCADARAWTIYVKARVRVYRDVFVLRTPIKHGEIILPSHVRVERRVVTDTRGGGIDSLDEIAEKQAARNLPAGVVLQPEHLARVQLVRRGQTVVIWTGRSHFEISMTGEALMDGVEGQRIRVRNQQSNRIIEGVVTGPGSVRVAL